MFAGQMIYLPAHSENFWKEGELDTLLSQLGAEQGDCVFIVSDKTSLALSVMGALRLTVAKTLGIIPENKWNYLWITEMPFFEYDEGKRRMACYAPSVYNAS